MKRRLFHMTTAAIVGYSLAWADRAYGHAPVALFSLVAAVSWFAGAAWTCSRSVLPLCREVAEAHRERDDLAARLAELEDGGRYTPIRLLPQQEQR